MNKKVDIQWQFIFQPKNVPAFLITGGILLYVFNNVRNIENSWPIFLVVAGIALQVYWLNKK